jgi:Domain of unknown function (DUF397)
VNELDPPKWVKSSRCTSGTCVEVAVVADQYLIRDSKRPDMAPLTFTRDEWSAFVQGVSAGEFRF